MSDTILALLGFATVITVIVLLLRNVTVPALAFVSVSTITAAILVATGAFTLDEMAGFIKEGVKGVHGTAILFIFSVLFFGVMTDAGMFDKIIGALMKKVGNNVVGVALMTCLIAIIGHLDGGGASTFLITIPAMLPVYKRLHMRRETLLLICVTSMGVMNLLPWGGPTARAMAVLDVGSEILAYLLPGMLVSVLFVIFVVARVMGKAERKRLGVTELTHDEIEALVAVDDPETLAIRRPKNFAFNGILTIVLIAWLVAGSFIAEIEVPSLMLFMVGTCIALLVNYPNLKDQSARIGANGGDAVQVVVLVFGAGVFMGLFQGSGMADALAQSLVTIIPRQLGAVWGIIVALISAPGTFFLSNDGFYFGVLPALAEAGYAYGFTPLQMALASLMGQAFHLLSPLVAFIYLLLRLTGLDMGEWQRAAGKWAACIFAIFAVTIVLTGHLPLFIPQG